MRPVRLAGFLVGLEGVALLRAEVEGAVPGFAEARLAEVERILANVDKVEANYDEPVVVDIDTVAGYSLWAATYDHGDNPLLEVEGPAIHRILDTLPPGDALDAACGTGRHTRLLVERGHRVIGVDSCEAMLERARAKVAEADLRQGDLTSLPLGADSVDLVLCTLALTHQPALGPVLAEFARVLRPGGRLVTSDIHYLSLYFGGVAAVPDGEGRMGRMPASRFLPSDYLRAALDAGYTPLDCQEVAWPDHLAETHGGPAAQKWCPEGSRAAHMGLPAVIIWQLQAPGG